MKTTSADFKTLAENPYGARYHPKITVNSTEITDDINDFNYTGMCNAGDKFSIGNTCSAMVTFYIDNPSVNLSGKEIEVSQGINVNSTMEYVKLGKFKVLKPSDIRGRVSYQCVDRMTYLMDMPYFSQLSVPTTDVKVLQEICSQVGISLANTNLTSHTMNTIPSGYTRREVISYMAQFQGKNAIINDDGNLELIWYKESGYAVDDNKIYFDGTADINDETDYTLGYIECTVRSADGASETTLKSGTGTTGIRISNPFMTQAILDEVFSVIGGFSFRSCTFEFLGDFRLEVGDIVTVNTNGKTYKVPIMQLDQSSDGGVVTTITSVAETDSENEIDITGPFTIAMDRYYAELVLINKAMIDKLTVEQADIRYLQTNKLDAIEADIENAVIDTVSANYATIKQLNALTLVVSGKLEASELNAKVAELGYVTADTVSAKYATIEKLNALDLTVQGKLTASEADLRYADITLGNIDMANINVANIGLLFAKVGLIDRATIVDGHVTGYLDAVEINANSITAGTLIADRLLLKGSTDGLLYAINNLGELTSTNVDTLDGTILTQRTVTADKLVANSITANELDVTNIFGNSAVLSTLTSQTAFINAISSNSIVVGAKNNADAALTGANSSVKSITMHYLATSASSGVTTSTSGWTTKIQAVTSTKKYLWTYQTMTTVSGETSDTTPVISGVYGDTGATGATGATGNGVKSTTITYQVGSSGTTVPTGTWSTSIPTVSAGQYLWTRTVTTYTDGTTSTSYSVGRNGTNGTNGKDGTDGVGIKSIANKYAVSTSNSTAPTTWYDSVQTMTTTNKYLWNYEIVTYTDNTTSETSKRVIGVYGNTGASGSNGKDGTNGKDGADGKGISSIMEYYLASSSSSDITTLTTGWTTSMQTTTTTKKYLWNYEVITYTDGTNYTSTPVIIGTHGATGAKGDTGADGTSVTIKSTSITYRASSSGTTAPTGTWSSSVPTVSNGQYLWTKTVVTYSDNTSTTAYSVAYKGTNGTNGANGTNGKDGTSCYTHIRYSANSDGSGFVSAPTSTTVYIGVYTGTSSTAPTSASSYSWSKYVGDKGATGNGINSITYYYATTTTQTAPSASSITSTSIPTLSATNKYLWQKEVIDYTDSTVVDKTSVILLAVYGDKGDKGATGATGEAGVGIETTVVSYQAGSSGTSVPTGTWSSSVPSTSASAPYLWTRIVTTYTDGTSSTSYSVGSTPESIEVGGRNLIVDKNTSNGWINNTGVVVPSTSYKASDYISVTPGETLIFQLWCPSSTKLWIDDTYFDSNKNYLSGYNGEYITSDHIIKKYTVPSGASYVRISYGITDGYKVKLERGNRPTDWSPAPEDISVENIYTPNTTTIDGGKITTRSVTTDKIATDAIKSLNYIANASGSFLNLADGSFDSKYFKWNNSGKLTATSGKLAQFTFDDMTMTCEVDGDVENAYIKYDCNYSDYYNYGRSTLLTQRGLTIDYSVDYSPAGEEDVYPVAHDNYNSKVILNCDGLKWENTYYEGTTKTGYREASIKFNPNVSFGYETALELNATNVYCGQLFASKVETKSGANLDTINSNLSNRGYSKKISQGVPVNTAQTVTVENLSNFKYILGRIVTSGGVVPIMIPTELALYDKLEYANSFHSTSGNLISISIKAVSNTQLQVWGNCTGYSFTKIEVFGVY